MEYTNGLAKKEFLQYMYSVFSSVYENSHSRALLENVVDYCTNEHFTHSKNVLFYTLEKLIPEITPQELWLFVNENSITDEVRQYCGVEKLLIIC